MLALPGDLLLGPVGGNSAGAGARATTCACAGLALLGARDAANGLGWRHTALWLAREQSRIAVVDGSYLWPGDRMVLVATDRAGIIRGRARAPTSRMKREGR